MNNKNIAEDGKATRFSSTNQPDKTGRKPSIKNQLKELMLKNGELIIPKDQVIKVEDNGDVVIKTPTEMQLALKLKQMAMNGRGSITLKAIQLIMEQIDGKPRQDIGLDIENVIPIMTRRIEKGDE